MLRVRPCLLFPAATVIGFALWSAASGARAAAGAASHLHAHLHHVHAGPRTPLASPRLLGAWGDWQAATHQAAGSTVCYAYTRTASSTPKLPGRGDVVLTVTERQGTPRDAVALSAGFTYPPGSAVEVTAGAVHLAFYTAQRSAFARSGEAAVHAFHVADRANGAARAHSPAPRGRSVTDIFSLKGFDDAHAAIERACPHA